MIRFNLLSFKCIQSFWASSHRKRFFLIWHHQKIIVVGKIKSSSRWVGRCMNMLAGLCYLALNSLRIYCRKIIFKSRLVQQMRKFSCQPVSCIFWCFFTLECNTAECCLANTCLTFSLWFTNEAVCCSCHCQRILNHSLKIIMRPWNTTYGISFFWSFKKWIIKSVGFCISSCYFPIW